MNRHRASGVFLSMISAQTRSAFVARENRFTLFRIMLRRIDAYSVARHTRTRLPPSESHPTKEKRAAENGAANKM
ncbi:hypothetical protein [Bradyrhizobium liaoningense]|uniref:hypothetical protein n=1 Tax=Bradyrhizobium liaoningense TaxID=43992 RepID=UPI001BAD8820|nr:hypothetical protein [Bradyrhizobium liaoningense]MBR0716263.1 hypothetical protein [Bradyrhizobium liaoningense]